MKTMILRGKEEVSEMKDTSGTTLTFYQPKLRLLNPYTLVANRAVQNTKSGLTHIATLVEHEGVTDMRPMTNCGQNTGARPKPFFQWVQGPVRITCRKCTIFALSDLAREGKLPGCDR